MADTLRSITGGRVLPTIELMNRKLVASGVTTPDGIQAPQELYTHTAGTNTWQACKSDTGAGVITFMSIRSGGIADEDWDMRLLIDGVEVYSATTCWPRATATSNNFVFLIGHEAASASDANHSFHRFNESFSWELRRTTAAGSNRNFYLHTNWMMES